MTLLYLSILSRTVFYSAKVEAVLTRRRILCTTCLFFLFIDFSLQAKCPFSYYHIS